MVKFGKQIKRLAEPTHLNHFIAYDVLKKAISIVVDGAQTETGKPEDLREVNETFGHSTTTPSCRPPDSRFHDLLQHELSKVNRFFSLQLRTLLDKFREAQKNLLTFKAKQGRDADEALSSAEHNLEEAAEELVALEHFRRLNFTGFRKIVKKFDKQWLKVGSGKDAMSAWFMPQLLREFFVAVPFDAHIMALSLGYASLRRHRRGNAALSKKQDALQHAGSCGCGPSCSCSPDHDVLAHAAIPGACALHHGEAV